VVFRRTFFRTRCHKGTRRTTPQVGAGENWVCVEAFERPDGVAALADYDVSVRTDGCFVATGPTQLVGPAQMQAVDGRTIVNPLAEFDACFPT